MGTNRGHSLLESTARGFNPRPRVGTNPGLLACGQRCAGFNPAPPRGDELDGAINQRPGVLVSIRAPAWGRTRGHSLLEAAARGFNPRPRVGTNGLARYPQDAVQVFQSAPPRGDELKTGCALRFGAGFQSAPPRGDERFSPRSRALRPRFQSAPPRGDELRGWLYGGLGPGVSIRAPAWGRTLAPSAAAGVSSRFQSAPPRGDEQCHHVGYELTQGFQSAPPRGDELTVSSRICRCTRFNPRPRVGTNLQPDASRDRGHVSIRAPAWGRTRQTPASTTTPGFQSAPPRGDEPPRLIELAHQVGVSIRAPAWGRTRMTADTRLMLEVSIRAPAWGRTVRAGSGVDRRVVSIRAPAWGRTSR